PRRLVREGHLHDTAPCAERLRPHAPLQRPQQELEVELVRGELATSPALPPDAESFDHRLEVAARGREMVGPAAATQGGATLDDAFRLELLQAARKQRRRGRRHPPLQLGEPRSPRGEVAQDECRPALAEQLGSLGNRTELAIASHGGPPASGVEACRSYARLGAPPLHFVDYPRAPAAPQNPLPRNDMGEAPWH